MTSAAGEVHRSDSHCRCGKLLTKCLLEIRNKALPAKEYADLRDRIEIKFGSQTKCRRCKTLRTTLTVADPKTVVPEIVMKAEGTI